MKRNTIQRMLVLDAVRSMSTHPTADEVFENVASKCPSISKGTVYRNLNALAYDGELLRVPVANAPDRFDRTPGTHCHCRCLTCGNVYDYNLEHDITFADRLNPDFIATDYELIIDGYCKSCKESANG